MSEKRQITLLLFMRFYSNHVCAEGEEKMKTENDMLIIFQLLQGINASRGACLSSSQMLFSLVRSAVWQSEPGLL